MSDYVDLDGALDLLGVSRPTLYRWLREGRLTGFRVGRQWRFDRADLEGFLRRDPADPVERDLAELVDWFRKRRESR